jgi:hypothetical protein
LAMLGVIPQLLDLSRVLPQPAASPGPNTSHTAARILRQLWQEKESTLIHMAAAGGLPVLCSWLLVHDLQVGWRLLHCVGASLIVLFAVAGNRPRRDQSGLEACAFREADCADERLLPLAHQGRGSEWPRRGHCGDTSPEVPGPLRPDSPSRRRQ